MKKKKQTRLEKLMRRGHSVIVIPKLYVQNAMPGYYNFFLLDAVNIKELKSLHKKLGKLLEVVE